MGFGCSSGPRQSSHDFVLVSSTSWIHWISKIMSEAEIREGESGYQIAAKTRNENKNVKSDFVPIQTKSKLFNFACENETPDQTWKSKELRFQSSARKEEMSHDVPHQPLRQVLDWDRRYSLWLTCFQTITANFAVRSRALISVDGARLIIIRLIWIRGSWSMQSFQDLHANVTSASTTIQNSLNFTSAHNTSFPFNLVALLRQNEPRGRDESRSQMTERFGILNFRAAHEDA